MIISSEHHNLLEQFIAANKAEGVAIKALRDHIAIPNHDRNITAKLMQQMEDAHIKAIQIHKQLEAVRLDR